MQIAETSFRAGLVGLILLAASQTAAPQPLAGIDPTPAAATAAPTFVDSLYTELHQHPGDPNGIAYWNYQLAVDATTPAQVVEAFLAAPEVQLIQAPVLRLYFTTLARPADPAGFDYYTQALRSGGSLDSIAAGLIDSAEFEQQFGTGLDDSTFIGILYQNALGYPPDPAGLEYWLSVLGGGVTRPHLAVIFAESSAHRDYLGNLSESVLAYLGLLGRAPDGTELAAAAGLSLPLLADQILALPEYAGPPPQGWHGLDSRPVNLTCLAPPRPPTDTTLSLTRAFPNIGEFQPTAMLQAPGDSSRWFLVKKEGTVLTFANDEQVATSSVFVDLTDRVDAGFFEAGLLGMAFHPDFQSNGQVFLTYTRTGNPVDLILSRFTSPDFGQTLDPASETVLLTVAQPDPTHQGGGIAFGPDGYLYLGLGDGGPGLDPFGNGQNTGTLLGSFLRIDVDGGVPYGIPPDNPLANGGGLPELYAWGFRNPWRWSFDRATGELWAGDVGQTQWEEINQVQKGGNYGWRIREGSFCLGIEPCDIPELIDPVVEYSHTEGCSVTGGYVYRGTAIPALQGTYLYADFCSGRIWGLSYDAQGVPQPRLLLESGLTIPTFAEGHDGEVYVLDFNAGGIFRLTAAAEPDQSAFPERLSETGCVDPADPTRLAAGLIPYAINAPFWSDGADKQRWLALPEGTTVHIQPDGDWEFPVGTVTVKEFRRGGRLIETRLLVRHDDGLWGGYSYEWNAAETDAVYVPGGKVSPVHDGEWIFPSSAQCTQCHTAASGHTLGPENPQLNRPLVYPQSGRTANQLATLDAIGVLDVPLGADPWSLPAMADPNDDTAALESRARAYLHSNCAQCHQPGGTAPSDMDLLHDTALRDMNVCDQLPQQSDLGIAEARLVKPGDPARSLLLARIQRRDLHGMPPLGSKLVDTAGAQLIEDWIRSLSSCF